MGLNNFFKINLPYGIRRNEHGQWAAFNREYRPLGDNNPFECLTESDFIYTDYGRLPDRFLMGLADGPSSVEMDENNVIIKVFFYNDTTNPSNHPEKGYWEKYFEKVRKLSTKKVR